MIHTLSRKCDQLQNILFYRNKALLYLYGTATVLHLLLWGTLLVNIQTVYQPTKEFITLHYKVGIGPDFVGPWYAIFAIPFIGLVVLGLNCALGKLAYHYERYSVYSLAVGACCAQIMLLWVLYLILKANLF